MASKVETVDHDCDENVEELSLEEENGLPKSEFATKTSKTDIAFILGDEKLYVSSVVIEMFSPVFEKMISEKVKNEQGLMEIEITGYSVEDFDDFLTCFYPGKDYELSDSSVFRILHIAHKFGVKAVIKMCERQLLYMILQDSTPPDLLSECMSVAYSYNLEKVKQQAFESYKAKQKDDFNEICIPLPTNPEARSAFLETCLLPRLILTENKYAFSLALVTKENGRHIDMADFHDARYGKLELNVNTVHKYPYVKGNNSTTLWGIDLQLNGTWHQQWNDEGMINGISIRFARGTNPISVSQALMAVLYRIHNVSSAKEDIFVAKQVTITGQNIMEPTKVTIDPAMRKAILEQYTVDGMFFMTAHILMNKPDTRK